MANAHPSPARIPRSVAVSGVLFLWLAYTTLQTLTVTEDIGEPVAAILGFLPGLLGVGLLLSAGLTRQECFLTLTRLSWWGFAVLAFVFVLALSAMLPFGVWQGWSWAAALIFAPLSGIAQELFFRSSLLPAIRSMVAAKPALALVSHAILFGLWHIGPLFLGAPIWAVIAIMLVPTISGIGWGWQVTRDRTIIWAALQHSLIWVIGLQFTYAG
jgi:membrane protease YdiL (CAAX protease family)